MGEAGYFYRVGSALYPRNLEVWAHTNQPAQVLEMVKRLRGRGYYAEMRLMTPLEAMFDGHMAFIDHHPDLMQLLSVY